MAKEEIAFSVSVDTGEGGKSLKALKQDFKEAQKELDGLTVGSKEYVKALQKLGGIRDNIKDLNDEINAFNPEGKVKAFGNVVGGLASGFQAAQGAAALFGGESKALEKTLLKVQAATAFAEGIKGIMGMGDAFKVLGNVLKANPIMLIATVIIGIGTALYELKDKIPFVGKAFEVLGKVLDTLIQTGKDFLDFLGLTNFKMDRLTDSIIKNGERIKKANADRYDSEIAAAKRAGDATELIEVQKAQAAIKANNLIISGLKQKGKLNEDELKQLTDLQVENSKYYQAIQDLNAADNARRASDLEKKKQKYEEDTKKHQEELDKQLAAEAKYRQETERLAIESDKNIRSIKESQLANEQAVRDAKLAQDEANGDAETERYLAQQQARADIDKMNAEQSFSNKLAYLEQQKNLELSNKELTESQKLEIAQRYAEQEHQLKQQQAAQAVSTVEAGLNAAKGLSDLYFAGQMKKAKGNAAAELALKKKQFKVDKAFNIVRATIDGIRSVQAALTQSPPLSYALAALNAVMAGANIAKIASAKFEGGESGGGGAPSLGASSGGVPIAPPTNGSTLLNPDGSIKGVDQKQPTVKAVVVETDITKTQKRVGTIESRAKL